MAAPTDAGSSTLERARYERQRRAALSERPFPRAQAACACSATRVWRRGGGSHAKGHAHCRDASGPCCAAYGQRATARIQHGTSVRRAQAARRAAGGRGCAGAGAGVDSAHVMRQEGVTVVAVVPRHPSPLLRRLHTDGPPARVSSGPCSCGSGRGRVVKASTQLPRAAVYRHAARPYWPRHTGNSAQSAGAMRACARARAQAPGGAFLLAAVVDQACSCRPASFFFLREFARSSLYPSSVSTDQTVGVGAPTAHSPQRMNGRPGTRAEVAPHSTLSSFTTTCAPDQGLCSAACTNGENDPGWRGRSRDETSLARAGGGA